MLKKYLFIVIVGILAASFVNAYTVVSNDTLYKIGLKFGIPHQTLCKINNLPNCNLIYPGQDIKTNELKLGGTLPIAGNTYYLAGSGITASVTSITLTSLTIPQTGYELQDSDFSSTFYITIEPGSTKRQEIVSCATVTQNANDTATLSGCSRGLIPFTPYTASTTYAFSHAGGTQVIFSDAPQLFNEYPAKSNAETITGVWTYDVFPKMLTTTSSPTTNDQFATKYYADSLTYAGAPDANTTVKGIVEEATNAEFIAGTGTGGTGARLFVSPGSIAAYKGTHWQATIENGDNTIAYGDVVYASSTTGRVYKVLATSPTNINKINGIAYEGSAIGENIHVLLPGSEIYDSNSWSIGDVVYVGDDGKPTSTAGTYKRVIGQVITDDAWVFNPTAVLETDVPTANAVPIADASSTLDSWITQILFGDGSDGNVTISVSTTLTRDMYYNNLAINDGQKITTAGWKIYVKESLTGGTTSTAIIERNATTTTGLTGGSTGGTVSGRGDVGPGFPTVLSWGGKGQDATGAGAQVAGSCSTTTPPYNVIQLLGLIDYTSSSSRAPILANGGGSGGGNSAASGASGGGLVLVASKDIVGKIQLEAKGANGASSAGGGGGGFVSLIYLTNNSATVTTDVSGGTGGTGTSQSGQTRIYSLR